MVKREFLHLGPPVVGLGKEFLFKKIKTQSDPNALLPTDQLL
jgi:hypothetical protein